MIVLGVSVELTNWTSSRYINVLCEVKPEFRECDDSQHFFSRYYIPQGPTTGRYGCGNPEIPEPTTAFFHFPYAVVSANSRSSMTWSSLQPLESSSSVPYNRVFLSCGY